MVVFYMIWKNNNKIQLTKNKMDLNNRKLKNHPSPNTIINQYAMWQKFGMYGGG